MRRITLVIVSAAAVVVSLAWFFGWTGPRPSRASAFGTYQGYSEQSYDGVRRASDYLSLRDGLRLAYELILPTRKGVVTTERLPVLFKYTPYLRTWTIFDEDGHNRIADFIDLDWQTKAMLRVRFWLSKDGHLFDPLFRTRWLEAMVKHGYAVVVVERPGTGASFGVINPLFEANVREIDEILDWIAAQPWSNGKIGMYGDSYQAMVQFPAAATGNPHLKAIFPASAPLELYDDIQYRGGVYNRAFSTFFAGAASHLETLVTPVDSDRDGALLAQALEQRRSETLRERLDLSSQEFAYRDSIASGGLNVWEEAVALYPFIDRINQSKVPVYLTGGWYDIFAPALLLWYHNLTVPKRLTIRPLDHTGMDETDFDLDYAAEAHRWFDYWLKGIQNGIMDEPDLHYYVLGAPTDEAWRASSQWPIASHEPTPLYLGPGKSGTVASANDGLLLTQAPGAPDAFDAYTVDYTTTTGSRSRWSAVNWPRDYPDMRTNDAKALTYTTPPLPFDVEVVGYPIAHLWLAGDAPDLDVFVYLEHVDRSGASTYVTEGTLRASHRALSEAPFKNLDLPFHSHYRSDLAPLPGGKPVELAIAMLPTGYRFPEGSRIRIAIAFTDRDNFDTPLLSPPPHLQMLRGSEHASYVELPVAGEAALSLLPKDGK
jgi:putative CocE/NonD family hydrolase